jgi:thiol:disulfide interchange protein DsbG
MNRLFTLAVTSIAASLFAATSFAATTTKASLSSANSANTTTATSPGAKLINKVAKGQLAIIKKFKAVADLTGYVVESKGSNSRKMIVYSNKSGKYLFIGNIISSEGQNMTQSYTQKYINAGVAKSAYAEVSSLSWFAEGSNKASHKVYIVIDPNCIFCHEEYDLVQPLIKAGKLQVRWVPVGFLKPTSKGKAAAILAASTNKKRVAMLMKDETSFNVQEEEGALTPLANNNSMVNAAAFSKVEKNTSFFNKYVSTFIGTPVILYKNKEGSPELFLGLAREDQLNEIVKNMSASW